MSGAERIAAERQRQIDAEGWTSEHDDTHTLNELAEAAACYALETTRWSHASIFGEELVAHKLWPWDAEWWKPAQYPDPPYTRNVHNEKRIRNLEKAGALVAAEIDRLLRAGGDPANE